MSTEQRGTSEDRAARLRFLEEMLAWAGSDDDEDVEAEAQGRGEPVGGEEAPVDLRGGGSGRAQEGEEDSFAPASAGKSNVAPGQTHHWNDEQGGGGGSGSPLRAAAAGEAQERGRKDEGDASAVVKLVMGGEGCPQTLGPLPSSGPLPPLQNEAVPRASGRRFVREQERLQLFAWDRCLLKDLCRSPLPFMSCYLLDACNPPPLVSYAAVVSALPCCPLLPRPLPHAPTSSGFSLCSTASRHSHLLAATILEPPLKSSSPSPPSHSRRDLHPPNEGKLLRPELSKRLPRPPKRFKPASPNNRHHLGSPTCSDEPPRQRRRRREQKLAVLPFCPPEDPTTGEGGEVVDDR